MSGITRRTSRLLAADGRTLILAFDHGQGGANFAGMAHPGETLAAAIAAGADAVLTTVGIASEHDRLLARTGLVLSLDLTPDGLEELAVREAVTLGADMGKIILTPWNDTHPSSSIRARRFAAVCHQWDFPLMVEPIPVSFQATQEHTPEKIGRAAKIACEIGADLVKMQYSGEAAAFAAILNTLYRPVVVLGGPQRDDPLGVLRDVREAIDAGAIGIAIGRNIWAHEQPARMVAALGEIIHGGASVDQAARELRVLV